MIDARAHDGVLVHLVALCRTGRIRGATGLRRQRELSVGLSVGIVTFHKLPASASAAVEHTDALMYRVKRAGKNATDQEVVGVPSGPRETTGATPA